jgi:hypothetical protein
MPLSLRTRTLTAAAALAASLAVPAGVASASATSLYDYDLRDASSSAPNGASRDRTVPLELQGDWSSDATGVTFAGNTSGKQSIGVADPPSGSTIDVSAGAAVGAVIDFTLGGCSSDSDNLAQIGRFAAGEAQIKLQLSSCSGGVVKPQCRVAGAKTPSGAGPVTGSGTIEPGKRYVLECIKSPDSGSSATLTIRLTDVAAGTTTATTATIPDTGRIVSSKALSVANKYPLPTAKQNTDQYAGVVRRVEVCTGSSVSAVRTCLE